MVRTYVNKHCRFLSAQLVGALTGLMVLFGAAETAWADETPSSAEEPPAVTAEFSAVTEITPEELSVSVTVETDLDLPEELAREIGPGIGMAPEGLGSGGKWTSSARLERILGPGEDPEHPRFYNIVNGKITGIVVR